MIRTPRAFVDTNLLVYAHAEGEGEGEPRAARARSVLRGLWQDHTGALSTQVLQEFYVVATRKASVPVAPALARSLVTSYSSWCHVISDATLIVAAGKLAEQHRISFWDALIIEAALRSSATRLLSVDLQHGRQFGDVLVENPFLAA